MLDRFRRHWKSVWLKRKSQKQWKRKKKRLCTKRKRKQKQKYKSEVEAEVEAEAETEIKSEVEVLIWLLLAELKAQMEEIKEERAAMKVHTPDNKASSSRLERSLQFKTP